MKTALLLDVILYRTTELYQHCRGSSCLDHQGLPIYISEGGSPYSQ